VAVRELIGDALEEGETIEKVTHLLASQVLRIAMANALLWKFGSMP
jgi:hypothetical protein